ncbi:MAG: tetratricopeptide repeat protein [Betaproteobacteria bacterium]|nr:tetratricopeptide repeat protein [Betaproteobacteria bacterium]
MFDRLRAAIGAGRTAKPEADALYLRGEAARRQGRLDEAIALLGDAVAANGSVAAFHFSLGCALQAEGKDAEATVEYRQAVSLAPDHAHAQQNLGGVLASAGDYAGALGAFDRVLVIDPESTEAHFNRGIMLLALGDYPRGWPEYEWRWKRPEFQTLRGLFKQAWWDGSDLAGRTILLFAEQGFGDAIQFIRYASVVAAAGARVVVDCQPPLKRLFRQVNGVAAVLESDADIAHCDLCCPLMSLPGLLGTTLRDIPAVPYLAAGADDVETWRRKVVHDAAAIRVGLVWASNPATGYAWQKSLAPEMFAPLAQVPGVAFYSLQTGGSSETHVRVAGFGVLQDMTDALHDFADTAALISHLDLVISVDTAVAHLAGAMGKDVWTVLPAQGDWRWLTGRGDSPWYPSMRLFRQHREGDWSEVIGRLVAELGLFEAASREKAFARRVAS